MKLNIYFVTHSILLFSFSRYGLCVWQIDGGLFTKTKKGRLINTVCFRVRSIKKITQGKMQWMVHGNDMKMTVSVGWCENNLTYSTAQHVCIYTLLFLTFYIVKKYIFSYLSFYKQYLLFSAINLRGLYLTFTREEYCIKLCFGSFYFAKQTGLLSILLPSVHIYVINFFQN